jgi:integrase
LLGVVRDLRSPRSLSDADGVAAYQEHLLAEYVLTRLAHGAADSTIRKEIAAVEEFLIFADVAAWEIEHRHADRFLGYHQRSNANGTRRGKAAAIDSFFTFLELRYAGEIHHLTGKVVASPIDSCNRPHHGGEFKVQIPPSPGDLATFFVSWRESLPAERRWLTATRSYVIARLAAEVGLRLREVCMLGIEDLHFSHGPLGKVHVRMGKGARGSGPRERLVPMLGDTRELLTWWVQEVRGEFRDDWTMPRAPLFPSEREGHISGSVFAKALGAASERHLGGPVRRLTPHLLRHAAASRLYGEGISLAGIQQLLGHRWMATTIRYVHVSEGSVEAEYLAAAERSATRFKETS